MNSVSKSIFGRRSSFVSSPVELDEFEGTDFLSELPPWSSVDYFDETSRTSFLRRHVLCMGKGDGKKKAKKKKKKKKPGAGGSSSSSVDNSAAGGPAPQRVSNNINVPVRTQIRYAQIRKQRARSVTTSFRQRTSYRRQLTEEEKEAARLERKELKQKDDLTRIMTVRNRKPPLLLVDGYNVIYKWPSLKKMMKRGDLEGARNALVEQLEDFKNLKMWNIECVFDGGGRSSVGPLGYGPGGFDRYDAISKADQAVKKQKTFGGITAVFSGRGASADSYIERKCWEAKNVTGGNFGTVDLVVATDDSMIRMSAMNAGVMCMGSERLVMELKACRSVTMTLVEQAVNSVNSVSFAQSQSNPEQQARDRKRERQWEEIMALSNKGRHNLTPEEKRELRALQYEYNNPGRKAWGRR